MSFDDRRRKITSSYGATGNRSAFGYWIPLALTVTAATVGLAAWVWSERSDEDEESNLSESEIEQRQQQQYYGTTGPVPGPGGAAAMGMGAAGAAGYAMSGGLPPGPGPAGFQGGPPMQQGPPGYQGPPGPGPAGFQDDRAMSTGIETRNVHIEENSSFVSRISNALGFSSDNRDTSYDENYDAQSRQMQQRGPMQPGQQQEGGWFGKAAAGAAAAGAMVGGAMKSLREGDGETFSDQEKWSEEADKPERSSPRKQKPMGGIARQGTAQEFYSGEVEVPRQSSVAVKKRKTIAIVVSSVEMAGSSDVDLGGHASILAHLPEHINPETTRIFVLIYAPSLSVHPLSAAALTSSSRANSQTGPSSQRSNSAGRRPSSRRQSISGQSTTSSYANIATPSGTEAHTPGDFPTNAEDPGILSSVSPRPISSTPAATGALEQETTTLYKTLHNQALALVDKDTQIFPFTSLQGHKHILRNIGPEIVYIQESLCGRDGELVSELRGWVRQVVVVIGDEGGLGGLVDTDTEAEGSEVGAKKEEWWKKEEVRGVGRGVGIVESLRVGEDWRRRVDGHD